MKTANDAPKLSFTSTRECRVLFRESPLEWRAEEKDPGSSITHVEDDREEQAKGKTLEDPRSGQGLASRIVNVQSFADRIVSLSSGDRVLSLPFVRGG